MHKTRAAALAAGETRSCTGKPCKYGHETTRHTKTGACHACARQRTNARYAAAPVAARARVAAYQAANVAELKATKRRVYLKKEAYYKAKQAARRIANPEPFRQRSVAWRAANPEKNRNYCSKRHAAKLLRSPSWADAAAIRAFYDACPQGMHVDHILPLQGKLISGLHVLDNLQYLHASDNLIKKNKFTPYMVIHAH